MPDTPLTPPALAQAVDHELSPALGALTQLLQELQQGEALSPTQASRFQAALARTRRVAQLHARMGRLPEAEPAQHVALDQVLHEALVARQAALQARGIEIRHHLQPLEVMAEPHRLEALVATVLDWTASQGRHALMKLSLGNWPEHALLVVRVTRPQPRPGDTVTTPHEDGLVWQLMQHLSQALAVHVHLQPSAEAITLSLEFTRTVRQSGSLSALDLEPGNDTLPPERARLMRGAEVLLITEDAGVQRRVDQVCTRMDLRLTPVATVAAASRYCEHAVPSLVIIDEKLHDDTFDQLHAQMVRQQGALPLIEVGSAEAAFAISGWGEASASRVGRDDLVERLPAAIVLELGMTR